TLPKRGGRVLVDECLAVPGCPGVWAIGDCALVPDGRGGFHPPTAQHALREGRTAARNVAAAILGRAQKPFRFRTARRDRPARGRRERLRDQVLGIRRLVALRSEERRVGKECRSRWSSRQQKKNRCS